MARPMRSTYGFSCEVRGGWEGDQGLREMSRRRAVAYLSVGTMTTVKIIELVGRSPKSRMNA